MIRNIAFFVLNIFFLSHAAAIEAAGNGTTNGNLRGLTTTSGPTDCSTVKCAENPSERNNLIFVLLGHSV
jgi:hypothetical protein